MGQAAPCRPKPIYYSDQYQTRCFRFLRNLGRESARSNPFFREILPIQECIRRGERAPLEGVSVQSLAAVRTKAQRFSLENQWQCLADGPNVPTILFAIAVHRSEVLFVLR